MIFDISIVISSYNREDKILATVQTICESELDIFDRVELIIIDDGSPRPVSGLMDRLADIPEKIELRVIRQDNSGIGATRNRGLREAKADMVILLDDDILLQKDTLKKIVAAQREKGGAVIFGSYPFITHNSPSLEKFAEKFLGYDKISKEDKIEQVNGITSGLLSVSKSKLEDLACFYKDDLSIPAAEEHELMYRFYKLGKPIFHAKHISAIHNHHLKLSWLAQQQYKYGLATAEAFVKNPEIKEMEKFAVWDKSFHLHNTGTATKIIKSFLSSSAGRKTLFFSARLMERLFPKGNHDFVFGMLVSANFRAGYLKGLKKFTQ